MNGCNDEDDIDAIFVDTTWYLGNFYSTSDWEDDNNRKPVYTGEKEEEMRKILNGEQGGDTNRFYITFSEGTFTAKGLGNTFSGTWQANGKKNTLNMTILQGQLPNGTGLTDEIIRKFYYGIKEASYYRGNVIYLKIFPENKKSFMQFGRERK